MDHRHLTTERVTDERKRPPGIPLLGHSDRGSDDIVGHCGIPEVVAAARDGSTHALSGEVGRQDGHALGGEGRGEGPVVADRHSQRGQQDNHRGARTSAVDTDDRRVSATRQVEVSHMFHA